MLQLPFITAERLFIGRRIGLTLSRLKESGVCCRTSREANGTPSAQGSAPAFKITNVSCLATVPNLLNENVEMGLRSLFCATVSPPSCDLYLLIVIDPLL